MRSRKLKNKSVSNTVKMDELKFPDLPSDSVFNQFKQGDVVFGLQENHKDVGKKLEEKEFHHIYAANLNNPVVKVIVEDSSEAEIKKLDMPQQAHFQFLSTHRNYLFRKGGKPFSSYSANSHIYRRACKLILNQRKDNARSVHFITKGIDWERVCDKAKSQLGITDSELRSAYRDFKRNDVNPHLFFYDQNHQRMPRPPWEIPALSEHWQYYDELRHKKRAQQQKKQKAIEKMEKTEQTKKLKR